jgi:uncharacterized damage-inducible protein DinB
MINWVQKLFQYNNWAMDTIFSSLENFSEEEYLRDLGDGCGSVRDKVAHILAADKIWLERIQNHPSPEFLKPSYCSSIQITKDLRKQNMEGWATFLDNLNSENILQKISYKSMNAEKFETPLIEVLIHVANHATYHRGQVASLIRRIKGKPPVTDFIQFARNQN